MESSPGSLKSYYRRLLFDGSPEEQRLASAQLARLERRSSIKKHGLRTEPTSCEKTPLVKLIEAAVGPLTQRANGDWRGSCPWHSSNSGTCLSVFDGGRAWFCHSCRRGGDRASWYAYREGISRAAAFHKHVRSRFNRRPRVREVKRG